MKPGDTTDNTSHNRGPGVRYVDVSPDEAGQRVDNFLVRHLKGVPRPRLYRAIRRGEVRVNKGRVTQTYRLVAGDKVRLPPLAAAPRTAGTSTFDWESRIVHEDRNLLVVDKPSGWAVHGGSGISLGLIESLRANLTGRPTLELVHRLDRSTSGCLIVAKRRSALRALHEQFRLGSVEKSYLLLVEGDWQLGKHEVDRPLDIEHRRGGERTVRIAADGRRAITHFSLCMRYGAASLVAARPRTGRTHQIRVHAASCGHPIAGDERYGDAEFNRRVARLGLRRLFLHAASIAIEFPAGNPWHFSAPLPAALRAVLNRLESGGLRTAGARRRR